MKRMITSIILIATFISASPQVTSEDLDALFKKRDYKALQGAIDVSFHDFREALGKRNYKNYYDVKIKADQHKITLKWLWKQVKEHLSVWALWNIFRDAMRVPDYPHHELESYPCDGHKYKKTFPESYFSDLPELKELLSYMIFFYYYMQGLFVWYGGTIDAKDRLAEFEKMKKRVHSLKNKAHTPGSLFLECCAHRIKRRQKLPLFSACWEEAMKLIHQKDILKKKSDYLDVFCMWNNARFSNWLTFENSDGDYLFKHEGYDKTQAHDFVIYSLYVFKPTTDLEWYDFFNLEKSMTAFALDKKSFDKTCPKDIRDKGEKILKVFKEKKPKIFGDTFYF